MTLADLRRDYSLAGLAEKDLARDPFCHRPVGNGPFVVVEEQPGASLLLRRNDHFMPRPLLDEVVVKFVVGRDGVVAEAGATGAGEAGVEATGADDSREQAASASNAKENAAPRRDAAR